MQAVKEARGSLIGFLDDDNLPASDWVISAIRFYQEHPQAGAYGSQIHGDFEVELPENFEKIAIFLAIVEQGSKAYICKPWRGLPPGAGLVVSRQAWCESVLERPFLSGPTSQSLLTSEDTEVVASIQNSGWEIWYNPQMRIYHKIPRWRLERSYLMSKARGIGLSRHYIRMSRMKAWQRPFAFLLYVVNDLRRVIFHFIKYHDVLKTDLVAAFEMELFLNYLISPFYMWGIVNLINRSSEQVQQRPIKAGL